MKWAGCFCPERLLHEPKIFWYTLITHHFLHANWIHISLNSMCVIGILSSVERTLGSVAMFMTTIISMIPINIITFGLSYLFDGLTVKNVEIISKNMCSLGFSDVIWFHLMIDMIINFNPLPRYKWCEIMYFIFLILFDQVIMPYCWPWLHLSVVGHLAGFIVGVSYCLTYRICKERRYRFVKLIEDSLCLNCCKKRECFIKLDDVIDTKPKISNEHRYAGDKELTFSCDDQTVVTFGKDTRYLFDAETGKWTLIRKDDIGAMFEYDCKAKQN